MYNVRLTDWFEVELMKYRKMICCSAVPCEVYFKILLIYVPEPNPRLGAKRAGRRWVRLTSILIDGRWSSV
jgi:hypothetical protein